MKWHKTDESGPRTPSRGKQHCIAIESMDLESACLGMNPGSAAFSVTYSVTQFSHLLYRDSNRPYHVVPF